MKIMSLFSEGKPLLFVCAMSFRGFTCGCKQLAFLGGFWSIFPHRIHLPTIMLVVFCVRCAYMLLCPIPRAFNNRLSYFAYKKMCLTCAGSLACDSFPHVDQLLFKCCTVSSSPAYLAFNLCWFLWISYLPELLDVLNLFLSFRNMVRCWNSSS